MAENLSPPLTRAEREVVEAIGMPFCRYREMYEDIGGWLGISRETARTHVKHIADKIPNPDELEAKTLVWLWARAEVWAALYGADKSEAA